MDGSLTDSVLGEMAGSGGNTCSLQVYSPPPTLLYHDLSNRLVIRPASRSMFHTVLQMACFVLVHHCIC